MDIPQSILEKVRSLLSARFSKESRILQISPVAGGCIHHAHVLETSTGRFFLKWNGAAETGNFAAELKGLRLLAAHSRGFTAVPLGCGNDEKYSLLLLEFIRQGPPSPGFWPDFGRKLSELHRHTSQFFGLEEDNYIGRLHQSNRRHAGFVSFFTEERLEPQVRLARSGQLIDA
ncbi:MAG TPA: fructosamine kinase family protein, partial [Anseongella sp.]|nr:fructosamine kinase family protein [Anseongella sp.]